LRTLVLNGLSFKKQGVVSKICKALIPADQMLKLVLKDMSFNGPAVTNLCQYLSTAFTLQDLQLVNCSFAPQQLAVIAKSILTSPSLSTLANFSLKQNILRKHSSNKEFIADLIKFV
jgi:Ran GTPase-activating protein (RanGAP) involved in mRNA processing and transport